MPDCRIIEIDDRFELGPSVWQQAKDGDDLILRFSLKLLANSFDELLHILAIFTEQLIFCEGFKHHKRHLHIDRRYWTFSLFLLGFACEPMVYECIFEFALQTRFLFVYFGVLWAKDFSRNYISSFIIDVERLIYNSLLL